MASKKVTPEELSNSLIEKHQKFITEYRKEFNILDRIFVLKEKQDQLEYWLHDSKDDPERNQKYLRAMKLADKELLKLNEELTTIYSSNGSTASETNPNSRHKLLKDKISMHKEAIDCWNEKLQELSKDKKEKEIKKKGKVKKVEVLKKKKTKKVKGAKKLRKSRSSKKKK
ncbi:MAG: hypothetical protein U9Q22_00165 [Candidatus Altiarchaeota archaeon]|nr:hypothetical protein [Candidatus Altiarchaeota archaeon]